MTRRWVVLSSLLLVSVVAAMTVSGDGTGAGVVAAMERPTSHAPLTSASERSGDAADLSAVEGGQLARLGARRIDNDLEPLFSATRKAPMAKPEPLAPSAPPAAVAPPLPFQFLGLMIDDDKTTLFLAMKERNIAVSVGEMIDSLYRVDSIDNDVAVFTYLPMKQKQTLPIGEKS